MGMIKPGPRSKMPVLIYLFELTTSFNMRNLAPLFFAIIFSLFLMPFAQANTICDGPTCLTYSENYTTNIYQMYALDYVNDSFFVASKINFFYNLNESFLKVSQVSTVAEFGHGFTFGCGWNRDDGYFLGARSIASNNYFGKWDFTPSEISFVDKGRQYESMGDWYDGYYWIPDDNGALYKLNNNLDEVTSCSFPQYAKATHHLNDTQRIFIMRLGNLYLYDESCNEYANISLSDFGLGISGSNAITGNDDNTKIWIGTTQGPSKVWEFDLNLTIPSSTLTPISPIESEDFVNSILVMQLNLNAGLNGTLNCYVNDVLTHTGSYTNGTHDIDFSSGDLPDGANTWYCNFTDVELVWDFDLINFNVATGIMNTAGGGMAELFGFETDEYSTSTEKGRAFVSLILTFAIALGIGGYFKSAEITGMAIVGFLMIFTFTGDLPAWIGILLIIISGFIMVEWVKRLHGSKR